MFYIYGLHASKAALSNPRRKIEKAFLIESMAQKGPDLLQQICDRRLTCQLVDKNTLDNLVPSGAVHQGIVLKVHPLENYPLDKIKSDPSPRQIVVALDQVTDPQNVGSILRLGHVFGVKALVMPAAHTPPETGSMAKVASGALEVIPRCVVPNLAQALRALQESGFWSVGLTEGVKKNLREIDLNRKIILVLGSEGDGMRRLTKKLCDYMVTIPTSSEFSTLNVTTAAAISLYETFIQQE